MSRHFAHPAPTFGTNNKPKPASAWKSSIYYWWFEYLRRNEDYRKTCLNGGKGKCAMLYKDFGDIYAQEFKAWWKADERGARLFAEPVKQTIQLLKVGSSVEKRHYRNIVLEVPLDFPSTYLVKRFKEILDRYHTGKRGMKYSGSDKSNAQYIVTSERIDVEFLRTALRVWDTRKANPKMSLVELAIEAKLPFSQSLKLDGDGKVMNSKDQTKIKASVAATVSRFLRKADNIIRNVGKGAFPVSTIIGN